jgi:hypothetical protein
MQARNHCAERKEEKPPTLASRTSNPKTSGYEGGGVGQAGFGELQRPVDVLDWTDTLYSIQGGYERVSGLLLHS